MSVSPLPLRAGRLLPFLTTTAFGRNTRKYPERHEIRGRRDYRPEKVNEPKRRFVHEIRVFKNKSLRPSRRRRNATAVSRVAGKIARQKTNTPPKKDSPPGEPCRSVSVDARKRFKPSITFHPHTFPRIETPAQWRSHDPLPNIKIGRKY